MNIMNFLTLLKRKREAKKYGVPFRTREWYNFRAMLPREEREKNIHSYIEIFDNKGHYIDCPSVGKEIKYNHKGELFVYRIIGFENESRNRDWLYDSDYIHPIIEYARKEE